MKDWLRHANIQNTIIYARLTTATLDAQARKVCASYRVVSCLSFCSSKRARMPFLILYNGSPSTVVVSPASVRMKEVSICAADKTMNRTVPSPFRSSAKA